MMVWADEWFAKQEAKDPFFKKVRESQREFLKKWAPVSDSRDLPYPAWALE